ncbi:MAG: hypothetical protein ACLP7F_06825, partial [Acidimicrobiales bacterium]
HLFQIDEHGHEAATLLALDRPLAALVPADGVTGAKSLSGRFKLPLATGQDDGGASVSADQCAGWRPKPPPAGGPRTGAAVSALVRAVPPQPGPRPDPHGCQARPTVFSGSAVAALRTVTRLRPDLAHTRRS